MIGIDTDLVPNYHKMIIHKCLHCGFEFMATPGTLHALYCVSKGDQHNSEEPYFLMIWPNDSKQRVTFFNYDGTKSRKGWVELE